MKGAKSFYGTCTNGQFQRQEAINSYLKLLEGKEVEISVKKFVKRRSQNQNRFYWGVVIDTIRTFFEDCGDSVSPEDVHCFLKEHIAGMVKIIHMPDGSRKSIVETSTKLTTVQWEEYIEKIRVWAAEWDIDIPEPTPQNIDNH